MTTTNYDLFLSLTNNLTAEQLPKALVSDPRLALATLAEIYLRNPKRVEGAEFSFSRRDRNVAFGLATKFLEGAELSAEDVLAALGMAYRYRNQAAKLLPVEPEVTLQDAPSDTAEMLYNAYLLGALGPAGGFDVVEGVNGPLTV
jgi:hypothetical protein